MDVAPYTVSSVDAQKLNPENLIKLYIYFLRYVIRGCLYGGEPGCPPV
jgi:hypothetical protein